MTINSIQLHGHKSKTHSAGEYDSEKNIPVDREDIIGTLKSNAPMIFGVTMTMDMGYEFSAIVEEGVIYPEVGMVLYTEEKGELPPWLEDDKLSKDELIDKKNKYLKQFEVVPWSKMSSKDLSETLAMLTNSSEKYEN